MSDADQIGRLLAAILEPPTETGPLWTHTIRHPAPVEEPVEDEDGEMVLVERIPLTPSFTVERRPTFTGILSYLADEGEQQ